MNDWNQMADEIRAGNRRILARAITLVESSHLARRKEADLVIEALAAKSIRQALRIGFTGAPGVGKSTLINTLGGELANQQQRIAVVAIDPSSARSGGSILGDKTRMETLAREPLAFIRPSPSNNILGGVAQNTREVIFLCEQAGFNAIFVETTGVGQSEITVAALIDIFVLLVAPAGGDELQGVKRGIMELADLVVVTKADGELTPVAERTCAEYKNALRLFARRCTEPEEYPLAMTISVNDSQQVNELWQSIIHLANWRQSMGIWHQTRQQQELDWMHSHLKDKIIHVVEELDDVVTATRQLEQSILSSGTIFSPQARNELKSVVDTIRQKWIHSEK